MPQQPIQRYPRHLFLRFAITQLLLCVSLGVGIALGARFYLDRHITSNAIFYAAIWVPLLVLIYTLWSGLRLMRPLGGILAKTQSILESDPTKQEDRQEGLAFELDALEERAVGEWSDLDSALNRIHTDLRSKSRSLTQERGETETIISAISDAVLAVDSQLNLQFFNSQFLVLFGNKDMQGQQLRLSQLFRSPDLLDAFKDTIHDGSPRLINLPLYSGSSTSYYSLAVAPLRRASNEQIYGAVGVFRDVSELKRAEQIRIDFVANVSHELRTPLTSIKGYSQTLKEDLGPESSASTKKYLEIIERNVDRLLNLLGDLLNLSSLESGGVLERSSIPLKELNERILSQLEPKQKEKNQAVSLKIQTPILEADPQRVEQVLLNLVENAIKYAPKNSKIDVTWDRHADQSITLRVEDNGPGIATEHHGRLFERFYRVDPARARESGGTGLGLAIVKHIMQKHGGSVKLESEAGKGTAFVCHFPQPGPS